MTARQAARQQRRRADREFDKYHNYAGWGTCRCGRFAYLVGKTYEGKRCRECAGC